MESWTIWQFISAQNLVRNGRISLAVAIRTFVCMGRKTAASRHAIDRPGARRDSTGKRLSRQNQKSEARSSKCQTNSNRRRKFKTLRLGGAFASGFGALEPSNFDFVSDFGFCA